GKTQRLDEAVRATRGAGHGSLETRDAKTLGIAPQVPCYQRRIEMQRVAHTCARGIGLSVGKAELAGITKRCTQAVVAQARLEPGSPGPLPAVIERPAVDRSAEGAERMPVRMTGLRPVRELDAQLEGRVSVLQKIALIDAQKAQHVDDGWNR